MPCVHEYDCFSVYSDILLPRYTNENELMGKYFSLTASEGSIYRHVTVFRGNDTDWQLYACAEMKLFISQPHLITHSAQNNPNHICKVI